mmetsp:Transcript_93030/g.234336  ORF Transcript_93030/g.234336 Transcript_93030/m.234336 type:complete len:361 (+) Transcript_93030:2-1084(+)
MMCKDGFPRRDSLSPREGDPCANFACPTGFAPRSGASGAYGEEEAVLCSDPHCRLGACCRTEAVTCTCSQPQCCAQGLLPPASIDAGSSAGLRVTLVTPVTVALGGRPRWFYYLATGAQTLDFLRGAFGGTEGKVLKGYRVRLTEEWELEAVLTSASELEVHAGTPSGRHTHFWTSTRQGSLARALRHRLGEPPAAYLAPPARAKKHALLEVTEVVTVAHSFARTRRVELQEGVGCCFTEDDATLQGLPPALLGATFFALEGSAVSNRGAGRFTVFAGGVGPVTVFAIDVIDPFNKYGATYKQGFEDLTWERVDAPGFLLKPDKPWRVHVGCWRRSLEPGVALEVPHGPGLHGAIAVAAG